MRAFLIAGLAGLLASNAWCRTFSVVAYNVENLFDVDGVAAYDDYQPKDYGPDQMTVKLTNISRALSRVEHGNGPDIILFNEVEYDQTPKSTVESPEAWVKSQKDRYDVLLARAKTDPELAGIPAEAWLLKAVEDNGMTGYSVAFPKEPSGTHEDGHTRAIHNVIFTRFPIEAIRSHATENARTILEVQLSVDGKRLYVFGNHWKSGAGSPKTESDRRANAKTLRDRVDEILSADPQADIIIGGDLNSQYNQTFRYPEMKTSGINDVLRITGDETALRTSDSGLYDLWYELPVDQRGSDVYKDEWGTLIHLIVSRGLYDNRGIQYEDNSFAVLKIPGVNMDDFGLPKRWESTPPPGRGFSDHFPIYARFRTVDHESMGWMDLTNPSHGEGYDSGPVKVTFDLSLLEKNAVRENDIPGGVDFRNGDYAGRVFLVEAKTVNDRYIKVKFAGREIDVYSPDSEARDMLFKQRSAKGEVSCYGVLGTYKGNWQFYVRSKEWVK